MDKLAGSTLVRDDILLTDRVALITGGANGIGYGIALAMAEFGANVAIADIDGAAAVQAVARIEAKGRRAIYLPCDAIDRVAIRAAAAECAERLGGIDILVNNVGGVRQAKLADLSDRSIDRVIALNLQSVVAATQAVAEYMIRQSEGGSIINIASIEGMRAAPHYSVYAACKAGMLNFTRTMALELGEHRIRVNAIAPDVVITDSVVKMSKGMIDGPQMRAARRRQIPLQRAGNLDDCAGAAVFLASRLAAYVTGVTINVDGGTWASSGWMRNDAGGWELFPRELVATF